MSGKPYNHNTRAVVKMMILAQSCVIFKLVNSQRQYFHVNYYIYAAVPQIGLQVHKYRQKLLLFQDILHSQFF